MANQNQGNQNQRNNNNGQNNDNGMMDQIAQATNNVVETVKNVFTGDNQNGQQGSNGNQRNKS
jgi:hypothetical protein